MTLERGPRPRQFGLVTTDRVRTGVAAGLVAAAAVIGALLAFSWRADAALAPLIATGRAVLTNASVAAAALAGLGVRVSVAIVWGLVASLLVGRRRGWPSLVAVAVVTSTVAALAAGVLGAPLGLGFGLGLFPLHGAPLLFLHALFAAGLAVGMRIAR